jgi:hypothetical protein
MTEEREHERLDRILAEEIRAEYGSVDVPREDIWRSIAAARRGGRRPIARRAAWVAGLAAAAVAALLLVVREPQGPPERSGPLATASIGRDDLLLRSHLARTGRLLATVGDSLPPDAPREARALLGPTRAMLEASDSDIATRRLLEDAEVALALLVRAGSSQAPVAREVLRASLAEARIAERLQNAAGTRGG